MLNRRHTTGVNGNVQNINHDWHIRHCYRYTIAYSHQANQTTLKFKFRERFSIVDVNSQRSFRNDTHFGLHSANSRHDSYRPSKNELCKRLDAKVGYSHIAQWTFDNNLRAINLLVLVLSKVPILIGGAIIIHQLIYLKMQMKQFYVRQEVWSKTILIEWITVRLSSSYTSRNKFVDPTFE